MAKRKKTESEKKLLHSDVVLEKPTWIETDSFHPRPCLCHIPKDAKLLTTFSTINHSNGILLTIKRKASAGSYVLVSYDKQQFELVQQLTNAINLTDHQSSNYSLITTNCSGGTSNTSDSTHEFYAAQDVCFPQSKSTKQQQQTIHRQSNLFAAQLLIKFWDVVVPLGLVKVASDRVTKVVLSSKLGRRLTGTATARAVCQTWLREVQFSALFVDQEHVSM